MTFEEAIDFAIAKLASNSNSAKLDAQLLVCHTCNTKLTKLLAYPGNELSNEQLTLFKLQLSRRSKGEPIAYITGKKEFWSLDFIVNKHVLVPRPESELLVEITLDLIAEKQTPRIMDLGTGSGAIAISIAKERSDCVVVATDISKQALDVANLNAAKHEAPIQFIYSNWYKKIGNEKFDVIICNPPYVAEDDPQLHQNVTRYEPSKAVISNDNGLQDLKLVIAGANQYLSSQGSLIVEHGFVQATEVQQLFKKYGFKQVKTYKDLAQLDRVTCGRYK